jgi:uncharacterized protein YdeI (BOF family)
VEQCEEEKRMESTLLKKNNILQDSEANEEDGYPVPDPNKTMINDTKEPKDGHRNILKEEILQEITKNFVEKVLEVINQNIQDALK